ncbi:NADP-dependent oxidoreductase domain-containing protein [Hyaloraphidium curvatum]|nr:NADP-dependent oxidoreductase domain-containing protein [Hyaloraphidium curvatum]
MPDAHPSPLYKPLSGIPELLAGCGILSGAYGELESTAAEIVRRALYLKMNFFDTSVYYGESERILGEALASVRSSYPRSSYYLATKCGRYGYKTSECDFSGKRTRQSVMQSLERLRTDYLDVVYAHDVEFAASVDDVCGPGGILEELFKMKDEGLIGHVGISGFPLPVLLAIAEEQQCRGRPLDVVLSYCHFTLQNGTFASYAPKLRAAGVGTLISASPIAMGILGERDLPPWHPAPPAMRAAREEAVRWCTRNGWALGNLALRYALRERVRPEDGGWDATLVGLRGADEVENAAMHRDEVNKGVKGEIEFESGLVEDVKGIFKKHGMLDYSWESPSEKERDRAAIGNILKLSY